MSQAKQPKFHTPGNETRFKARIENERSPSASHDKKRGKNFPRFSEHSANRTAEPYGGRRSSPYLNFEQKITETRLSRAGGNGDVKVVVKSTVVSDKPKAKKTGPLSPRAPEKIRKNRAEEMKVFGENACQTLFAERPDSIVRAWATVEMSHKTGELFRYLAANKKAYHVVGRDEMAKVSGSEHHGGLCLLVKKRRPFTLNAYLDISRAADCLVLLDGLANNPQNIGGIIRTCACYGVKNVITTDPELLNSPNAFRVAEGGMEYVRVLQSPATDTALAQLRKAGYQIVHLSRDKRAQSVNGLKLQDKVVFVPANDDFAQAGDQAVNLSPANPLNAGLNVAVAVGVLLSKWVAR